MSKDKTDTLLVSEVIIQIHFYLLNKLSLKTFIGF
jgi:hypothetical protein